MKIKELVDTERKSRGWCRISLVLVSIKTCLFSFLSVPCFILLYVPRSLRIYSHSDCYIFPPVHYPKKREKCCVVCWGWKIRRIVDDERESFHELLCRLFFSLLLLFPEKFIEFHSKSNFPYLIKKVYHQFTLSKLQTILSINVVSLPNRTKLRHYVTSCRKTENCQFSGLRYNIFCFIFPFISQCSFSRP